MLDTHKLPHGLSSWISLRQPFRTETYLFNTPHTQAGNENAASQFFTDCKFNGFVWENCLTHLYLETGINFFLFPCGGVLQSDWMICSRNNLISPKVCPHVCDPVTVQIFHNFSIITLWDLSCGSVCIFNFPSIFGNSRNSLIYKLSIVFESEIISSYGESSFILLYNN